MHRPQRPYATGSRAVFAQELDAGPPAVSICGCPGGSGFYAAFQNSPPGCVFRTLDAGLPAAWVTGDTVYGSHRLLRAGLEARTQAYALAVPCKEQVEVQGTRQRADQVTRGLATDAWQRLSAGTGSKGPRLFDWACVELAQPEASGWQRWLVVRRSLQVGAKPAELAYVLVFALKGTTLLEMVHAIGSRWTVEQCFKEAKGEVGLDEYEVRSWQGWYRHVTFCMLAHAFLTALLTQSQSVEPRPAVALEKNGCSSPQIPRISEL